MKKFDFGMILATVLPALLVTCLQQSFEYRYQVVKEHYPSLKRWEYFMYGQHLMIKPKDEK